ncbi:unnamed protein product [Trypanosoma congolense IL3000]|uniref:WGS project CAEQ00000000 data, annotated contig 164 n=1 Tax=Trypanosoma congolense (strain IL3000) TaxID=1068625 RepID=F9W7Q8_TRYCI|nr:unnamed protein product [Trypanosoma congolense IL3000]
MAYEGVSKVCGVSVGAGAGLGWGTSLYSTAAMWDEVKKGCEEISPHSTKSTESGHSLYYEFLSKVTEGGNVKIKSSGSGRNPGMLGTAVTETEKANFNCNGKASSVRDPGSGSCIFYGDQKWEENIEWLKQFKTGLEIIDKLNNKTALWKYQLTTLQRRAKTIYEKEKAASQLEKEDMEEPTAAPHPNSAKNETVDCTTRSHRHSLLELALFLFQ